MDFYGSKICCILDIKIILCMDFYSSKICIRFKYYKMDFYGE